MNADSGQVRETAATGANRQHAVGGPPPRRGGVHSTRFRKGICRRLAPPGKGASPILTRPRLAFGRERFARRVERTIDRPIRGRRGSRGFRLDHSFLGLTLVHRRPIEIRVASFISLLGIVI